MIDVASHMYDNRFFSGQLRCRTPFGYLTNAGINVFMKVSRNSHFVLQPYLNLLMLLRAHVHNMAAPECFLLRAACFQRMFSLQQCSTIKRVVARIEQGRARPMPSADDEVEIGSHEKRV